MADPHLMSVAALGRAFAEKTLSPVEVTEDALARIVDLDPSLNAFYLVDGEGALAAAREAERRWRDGAARGPLDGIPTSVKDALAAKGWPSYRGSLAHRAEAGVWDSDAPAVARLREQGAVFLGRTTMPDFGILASGYSSKHGITRNPWSLAHNPGGSSSGSAAAVAAGIHPAAIGTDIVGSIRLPASFCGLFGLKPSQGRVPYYFPAHPVLVAGPITRTVEDAAILMNVVTQPDERDYTALPARDVDYRDALRGGIAGTRIGFVGDLGFGLRADPEVVRLARAGAERLAAQGCTLVPVEAAFTREELGAAEAYYRARCYAEFATFDEDRRNAAAVIRDWTRPVEAMSARALYDALNALRRLREKAMRLSRGVDFLLLPTVHIPPFAAEDPAPDPVAPFEPWANTFLFNLTEQPASSVPCGLTASGLPVGLQIVGQRYDDLGVLRLSAAFERAVGGFAPPPLAGAAWVAP